MKKTQFVVKLTNKSGPETFVKMPSIFTTHQLSSCPVFSRQNLEAPTGPRDLQRRWGGYEETGWDFVLFRVRHFMKNLAKISNCLWSLHDYWHYDISSHGILKLTYSMACYSKTTSPEGFWWPSGDRAWGRCGLSWPQPTAKGPWRPEDPPKLSNFALWEEDFHWYFDFESTEE